MRSKQSVHQGAGPGRAWTCAPRPWRWGSNYREPHSQLYPTHTPGWGREKGSQVMVTVPQVLPTAALHTLAEDNSFYPGDHSSPCRAGGLHNCPGGLWVSKCRVTWSEVTEPTWDTMHPGAQFPSCSRLSLTENLHH